MAQNRSKDSPRSLRLGLSERRVLLAGGDLVMAAIALAVALYFWVLGVGNLDALEVIEFLQERPPDWFFALPLIWVILLFETYDPHRASNWQHTRNSLLVAAGLGMGIYVIYYFAADPGSLPRRSIAVFAVTALLLTTVWRLLYIRIFTSPQFARRAIMLGAGNAGQALLHVISGMPAPYQIVALLDDDIAKKGRVIEGHEVLGGSELLRDLIEEHKVSDIFVAISGQMREATFHALLEAQEQGAEIVRMPTAYEELLGRVPINYLEADWLVRSFVDSTRVNRFYQLGKRLFDVVGGLVGVGILLVLTPIVSILTLIDTGSPIIFSQTRAGRGGKPYRIIKFRTMRVDAEKDGNPQLAQEDDQRTTRLGKVLRKTRIDEWPQFINVLRGDMSLVGPRPERPELIEHFERRIPFYRARLLERPGITGWAQVNHGYAATIEEMSVKLEYDLYYIKHRGPILDLVIILRTLATVFGFRGR
ncbi:MAG: sugar transferase [Anaerolineales bacterium]|nr:sugar transferase [Anaerolineales bacterium]